jgi:hypothetical protein
MGLRARTVCRGVCSFRHQPSAVLLFRQNFERQRIHADAIAYAHKHCIDGGNRTRALRTGTEAAATADGILLDASAIAADSDVVVADVVRNATLRMDDNPTSGSYQIISLWQNNLQAMRVERFFGTAVLNSAGIAVISDMVTT